MLVLFRRNTTKPVATQTRNPNSRDHSPFIDTFSPFPKKGTELDIARATSGKRGREERDGEGGKSRKVDIIRSDDWRASPKSRWRTRVSA